MTGSGDRALGMDRDIPRRDFLGGLAGLTALAGAPPLAGCSRTDDEITPDFAPERQPGYYPPALTGLRGSTDADARAGHALRDRSAGRGAPTKVGPRYDLVVVGAGISGLTAAWAFRRQAGPAARILVLDNHDDFGGHARRNEFTVAGRTMIGYGGTFAIDSPAPYSPEARSMLAVLGIDVRRWKEVHDPTVFASRGLGRSVFFDRETFGTDALVPFSMPLAGTNPSDAAAAAMWRTFRERAPMAAAAKADLEHLFHGATDYLPGLTSAEKKARLARMSYADYLTKVANAHPDVAKFLHARAHGLFGLGIDAVPAQDAWGLGYPGFRGLGLEPGFGPGMNLDARLHPDGGAAQYFHFPDGAASIARLLVRDLVRDAIPGSTADDVVTARCDYARLDDPRSRVRIRLNSTVVGVRHLGSPGPARGVEIVYQRGGRPYAVHAGRCVLACWHTVIPYICPELPEAQRRALAYAVKVPIVYSNVLLRDWQAFVKAGTSSIHAPGGFHHAISLDPPVSMGGHRPSRAPEEPIVLHLGRTPARPGLAAREQHKAGREELLAMSFEEIERRTRDQLARALAGTGFDPARDIAALTVNRWPHGYAYQYNSLYDGFWLAGDETPCERARAPFGRIAIANADASAYSYTDAAIENGLRAVLEIARAA